MAEATLELFSDVLKIDTRQSNKEVGMDHEHEPSFTITIENLSERGRQALEFAVDQARRADHKLVTPEHILLGLIREQRANPRKLPSYARARRMLGQYFDMQWLDHNHEGAAAEADSMKRDRQAGPETRLERWIKELF